MAYLINYWRFNDIRKYNHKHSNVSRQSPLRVTKSLSHAQICHMFCQTYAKRKDKIFELCDIDLQYQVKCKWSKQHQDQVTSSRTKSSDKQGLFNWDWRMKMTSAQNQRFPSFSTTISALGIVLYCAGFLRVELELKNQKKRLDVLEIVERSKQPFREQHHSIVEFIKDAHGMYFSPCLKAVKNIMYSKIFCLILKRTLVFTKVCSMSLIFKHRRKRE